MLHVSRTNTLFEQIIREEYYKLKQKYLNESAGSFSNTTSKIIQSYVDDPSQQKAWSIDNAAAAANQQKLMTFGAKPYSLTPNPDGMELVIHDTSGQPTDRLWFYHDGRVYAQSANSTYDYSISGNTIRLSDHKQEVGTIILSGGKAIYRENAKLARREFDAAQQKIKAASEKRANVISDKVQSWLDWAGVIPGIGDMLDAVNALWYFSKGKWFDGILSMIAVLPGLGSAIAIPIRKLTTGSSAFAKKVRSLDDYAGATQFKEVFEFLLSRNYLSNKQMSVLAGEFKELAELAKHSDGWVKRTFRNTEAQEALIQQLKGLDSALEEAAMTLEKQLGSAGTELSAQVGKTLNATTQSISVLNSPFGRVIQDISNAPLTSLLRKQPEKLASLSNWLVPVGSMSPKPLKRIAKAFIDAPWFPVKKIELLQSSMQKGFRQRLDEPEYLLAVLRTMPNRNSIQKEIADKMGNANIFNKSVEKTRTVYTHKTSGQTISPEAWNNITSNKQKNKYLRQDERYTDIEYINDPEEILQNLKSSKADSSNINVGEYKQIADAIQEYAEKDSPIFAMYVSDIANQWRHQYDINGMSLTQNFYGAKFADVISSEVEDTLEALGMDSIPDDEANGLLFNAIAVKVRETFAPAFDALESVKNSELFRAIRGAAEDKIHQINPFASAKRYNPDNL